MSFKDLEPDDPRQVGPYRIVALLGAGGMGRVYLGRSRAGRPFAVKVVRPDLARDSEFRRRFAREVTAARRVNGAFTAGVVDADPDGSPAWLATVYVPAVSLGEAVARLGPWPVAPVLALGAGLAEALEVIHTAGVVHRDLKPSNILLASDGPRVIDFGIALPSDASALTRTGTVMGTPGFISPEQLTSQPVGPAADVFALGAVLAYTATGVGPFGIDSPHILHYRAVHEEPQLDALPPELRDVVTACLDKKPDRRPTVAQLLDRLTAEDAFTGDAHGAGRADRGEETTAARPRLAGLGWMPDPVAQLVRERISTPIPHNPPPPPDTTPKSTLPEPPPRPVPDPDTWDDPDGTHSGRPARRDYQSAVMSLDAARGNAVSGVSAVMRALLARRESAEQTAAVATAAVATAAVATAAVATAAAAPAAVAPAAAATVGAFRALLQGCLGTTMTVTGLFLAAIGTSAFTRLKEGDTPNPNAESPLAYLIYMAVLAGMSALAGASVSRTDTAVGKAFAVLALVLCCATPVVFTIGLVDPDLLGSVGAWGRSWAESNGPRSKVTCTIGICWSS
ncbi:serine/threonine-protein kinase [Streptomyces sp. TRM49041]|uniref:serine/threonine-protein kinase n=1 Tax=Streptomyces sp. TRM49041 TaxID=2603216 RepID=UPI0021CC8B0F|nr:serine/threonine-protein kinase [Streptomyces sp. TRM49041]